MLQTYVISLKTPTKLLNTLNAMNIALNNPFINLNPLLINGVNGKTLTQSEIDVNASLLYSKIGPLSAIGVGMAHIKTWKEFMKSENKYGLILEDDCTFVDDFGKKLSNVLRG